MMEWMERLNQLMDREDQNINDMVGESTQAKNEDVGVINDVSGAGILAKSDGVLEGYSYYNLGFRFDPQSMSLSIYAPTIKMFTNDLQVINESKEIAPLPDHMKKILERIGVDA